MYDKYILSLKQLKQIERFTKINKPLLIYGKTGCGKTSLAKDILKEISMIIDSSCIKKYKNIEEEILNTIQNHKKLLSLPPIQIPSILLPASSIVSHKNLMYQLKYIT